MNLFINEIHILISPIDKIEDTSIYNQIINMNSDTLNEENLESQILILNIDALNLISLIRLCVENKLKRVTKITFASKKTKLLKDSIKSMFDLIDAAGGLVKKDDKYLFIRRLGKWDLPKGKMEDDEKFKETAVREVEEECSVKAGLVKKITTTWHYYQQRSGDKILKRTKWYLMNCLDDSQMKPQLEEDIEQIAFFEKDEIKENLQNSYNSIRFVFQRYLDKFL